jgi:hypothetical protein
VVGDPTGDVWFGEDEVGPSLLIFAEQEPSFSPRDMVRRLARTDNVSTRLYNRAHGLLDAEAATHALAATTRFLSTTLQCQGGQ